jgi:hypothetical protein
VGEALVQMITLKTELNLQLNEKMTTLEGEMRKKLSENTASLQGIK